MLPTPFALFVAIAAWRTNGDNILRTFMLCCLFGATAAFTLPPLGNAPVTPAVAMVPVLAWRAMQGRNINNILFHLGTNRAGFWLLILLLWGFISAALLPRLFAGETYVFTTSRGGDLLGVNEVPLLPNSTNITQPAYLMLGLIVYLSISLLLDVPGRAVQFVDAVLALATVNIVAALCGLLEFTLGFPGPTSWIKNASYTVFDTYEILGLPRITGTFPEASSFAGFTLTLFAFVAGLWRARYRTRLTGLVALILLALLLSSTSTTAYVALAVYLACLLLMGSVRWLVNSNGLTIGWGYCAAALLVAAVCLAIILRPEVFQPVWYFFEGTVFRKLESSSGVERSAWNAQAWQNFIDTYGLGTGLGSARASSYVFVLISNLGVLGLFVFGAFIIKLIAPKAQPDHPVEAMAVGCARHAVFASLLSAGVSAGIFDLGQSFYAFAAMAAATGSTYLSAQQRNAHV